MMQEGIIIHAQKTLLLNIKLSTFLCINVCFLCMSLTLDGPLEEGLAGLTGGHAIVVA